MMGNTLYMHPLHSGHMSYEAMLKPQRKRSRRSPCNFNLCLFLFFSKSKITKFGDNVCLSVSASLWPSVRSCVPSWLAEKGKKRKTERIKEAGVLSP